MAAVGVVGEPGVMTASRALFILQILLTCLVPSSTSRVQCQGLTGEPVDWFIVYKLPKMRHSKGTSFGDGHAQFYIDAQHPTWTLSPRPINMTKHAIYYTLQQVYAAKENSLLYLMFNDEKPSGGMSLSHGHTKGTLGFDSQSGFWLIHSAPKFPPEKKDGYKWADNASDYGQSFLCMSFAYKTLGILAQQLLYYYPWVYDHYFPPAALKDFPELADLVNSTRIAKPPFYSVRDNLTSLGGMQLTSFAKFTYFGADLYDALVAPTLKVPLLVESWQHGTSEVVLKTNCSITYKVYNVEQVMLPGNKFFKEDKDHSKYAVSYEGNWVCVGGINRETTQFKRGGGTLCFQDKSVWAAFMGIITYFEPCHIAHQ